MGRSAIVVALGAVISFAVAVPAWSQIKVGVVLPATGVGAAFGVPMQKTVPILPKTIAGQSVQYIVLDSNTDATRASADARKLITEDHVDVLMGDSTTPATLAMIDIAAESGTPLIAPTATANIVQPLDDKKRWVFKVIPNDEADARAIADYMAAHGVKSVGFIGFNDAFGQSWLAAFKDILPKHDIKLVADEFFSRTDTSVTAQALKLVSARPDIVFVAAGGTPAIVATHDVRARGFRGPIYQTHGVSTPEFIERGGKDVDGAIFAGEPFTVAADLPVDSPFRKMAEQVIAGYKAANNGEQPPIMAANMFDCVALLAAATPGALEKGKPGTPEFRAALRDQLEHLSKVTLNNGLLSTSPEDHAAFDPSAILIIKVEGGAFHLAK
jgi:branched-chain amino acid transport system substrate-binding protein